MVKLREGESFDSLLKRFKKEVTNAGIISDYRKHLEYTCPSEKRKRKSEAARKRAARIERKRARYNSDT